MEATGVLEVRRDARRPPAGVALLSAAFAATLVWFVWSGVSLTRQLTAQLLADPDPARYLVCGLLMLVFLGLVGGFAAVTAPLLQLVGGTLLRTDVPVLVVDDRGLRLADAGADLRIPWSSLTGIAVAQRDGSGFGVRICAPGPVSAGHDPLSRSLRRAARKGRLSLRCTRLEPTEEELARAIANASGGVARLDR